MENSNITANTSSGLNGPTKRVFNCVFDLSDSVWCFVQPWFDPQLFFVLWAFEQYYFQVGVNSQQKIKDLWFIHAVTQRGITVDFFFSSIDQSHNPLSAVWWVDWHVSNLSVFRDWQTIMELHLRVLLPLWIISNLPLISDTLKRHGARDGDDGKNRFITSITDGFYCGFEDMF